MIDIAEAVRQFLLDDAEVGKLAGNRIYVGELPRDEVENMPRKVAVIIEAGGLESNEFLTVARPRLDIWSYGETYHEAGRLDRAIYQALKDMDRTTVADVLLHGAALSGGPHTLTDSETHWRYKMRSITITADERSTA